MYENLCEEIEQCLQSQSIAIGQTEAFQSYEEEARNRIQNLADNLERGIWTLSAALGVAPEPTLLSKLTAVATAFGASSLGLGKEGFVESIYTLERIAPAVLEIYKEMGANLIADLFPGLERIPPYDPNNAATFETYGEYIARIQPIIHTLGDDPVELLGVIETMYDSGFFVRSPMTEKVFLLR